MKLKALDQVHISSVQADSLRAGQEFYVSEATGKDLLERHPTKFEKISDDDAPAAAPIAPIALRKAEQPAQNKAEAKPANKAERKPSNKRAAKKK